MGSGFGNWEGRSLVCTTGLGHGKAQKLGAVTEAGEQEHKGRAETRGPEDQRTRVSEVQRRGPVDLRTRRSDGGPEAQERSGPENRKGSGTCRGGKTDHGVGDDHVQNHRLSGSRAAGCALQIQQHDVNCGVTVKVKQRCSVAAEVLVTLDPPSCTSCPVNNSDGSGPVVSRSNAVALATVQPLPGCARENPGSIPVIPLNFNARLLQASPCVFMRV